jgi:hypothetical protein
VRGLATPSQKRLRIEAQRNRGEDEESSIQRCLVVLFNTEKLRDREAELFESRDTETQRHRE